jgi:KUP system potassium uptake protein
MDAPSTDHPATAAARAPHGSRATLSLGALGIVFGSIGTSPLYALGQVFFHSGLAPGRADVVGVLSLVVWAIGIVVAVKYALFVLRAESDGEGGMFALYGLLHPFKRRGTFLLLWALMLGAGLILGDGMISPAISVLAAIEGLEAATPAFAEAVVPVTAALLTALFALQFKGTAGLGAVFGPVLLVWFAALAALGLMQIVQHPGILAAFNPLHGLGFLWRSGFQGTLLLLGSLILVVTGAEAMYADLGHFGAGPIRVAWFGVVFPALLLNYLGQGAYLLGGEAVLHGNLFFSLVPEGLRYVMVVLATAATVIASQALISGAFTLASQATRLGLFPRLAIRHTHEAHAGQVYLPFVNWTLYLGCMTLVVVFGSSSALGAAYGLAVAGVMVITALAMAPVARIYWGWSRAAVALVWGGIGALSLAFLVATSLKFAEGGFVPLVVGGLLFAVMVTWRWGRKATFAAYSAKPAMTMAKLVEMHRASTHFMERNAVIMAPKPVRALSDRAPALMRLLWERYGVLPRNLIFVEVTHRKTPHIHEDRHAVTVFERDPLHGSIFGVEMRFGFMEEPNVEHLLGELAAHAEIDLPADRRQWIVHVSLENLLPARSMGRLRRLRLRLFVFLRRLSQPAYYYYGLGNEVQLSAEIIPVRVR